MTTNSKPTIALYLCLLLTGCAAGATTPSHREIAEPKKLEQPSVLFISIDDLKPMLRCYGDTGIHSPNIDRLAANGMVFMRNYCQMAVCGPSRASIMTGLRPDTIRIWNMRKEDKLRTVNPGVITMLEYFRSKGYLTYGTGKVLDVRNFEGNGRHDALSWTGYDHVSANRWVEGDYSSKNMGPTTERLDVPDDAYEDGLITNAAIQRLRKLAEQDDPFFLAMGLRKPHLPFSAPAKYWNHYSKESIELEPFQSCPEGTPTFALHNMGEMRKYSDCPDDGPIPEDLQRRLNHGYRACVSYADANVGKVLDELERLDLSDSTIIVLWGDHGWHLGDHGLFCKHSNFEQATRSPLIISYPGMQTRNTSTSTLTEFVDVYPTLCDLMGIEKPEGLEGVSLVPVLSDPNARVRKAAISQYRRKNDDGNWTMGYAYRTERYRYVAWVEKDFYGGETTGPVTHRELYDYEADPLETRNLAREPQYGDIVKMFDAMHAEGAGMLAQSDLDDYVDLNETGTD